MVVAVGGRVLELDAAAKALAEFCPIISDASLGTELWPVRSARIEGGTREAAD
jgi:hypothetical protein